MTAPLPAPELHRLVLPNGLRVVLAPDRAAPVVGVSVHYDVGFRSEPEGRTGFAHLFEHLMFQGSESLDKLAHFRHVQGSGGTCNASTRQDWTVYHQVLPSAALERALFLEADRMRAPRITAENLRTQVAVVSEEIRLQVLDRPYGGFPWIPLPPVLYRTFANTHNGYGDSRDLEQATLDDCAAFFDAHYPPGNAVLTVAGDIDAEHAADLVQRHFGDVPGRATPDRPALAEPPPQRELRGRHADPHAPLPAVAVGYRLPDPRAETGSYLACVVLAALLAGGDTSRLRRRLVHGALATGVGAGCGLFGAFNARNPDTFVVTATHPATVPAGALLAVLDEALGALAADGPTAAELAGATARSAASWLRQGDPLASRIRAYGAMELSHGNPGLVRELPGRILAVTADQVAAAAAIMRPDRRAVLTLEPSTARTAPVRPTPPSRNRDPEGGPPRRDAEEIGRTAAGPRPLPALRAQPSAQPSAQPPALVDTVLDTGLRVIAVRSPSVPMVELRLLIPFAGTGRGHAAAGALLASTLFSGTHRRTREELDGALARAGGALEAVRDPLWLRVSGSALATALDTLLDVLADVLTGSGYPAEAVARERDRLVERITVARADPGVAAREALQRRRYGDHPMAAEVPDPSGLAAIGADAVRSLHRDAVLPPGSVLVLVGDLDGERAVQDAAAALAGWRGTGRPALLPPLPDPPRGDLLLVNRPGAVQAQIRLCAPGVPRGHERYPALHLANLVFAGYFSSRLVANIREDNGFSYAVRSAVEANAKAASVLVEFETSNGAAAPALGETRRELDRLTGRPPSESEVAAARRYAIGSLLISTASQPALASVLADLVTEGLDPEWLRLQAGRLAAVTVEDVARAARDFLPAVAFAGVVVGDGERLSAPLEALGWGRIA